MADELIAAQIIEPGIFTKSEQMYVDICTTPGPRYGDSMFWAKNWEGAAGAGKIVRERIRQPGVREPAAILSGAAALGGLVNVLQEVDHDRFKKLFVDLMTKPLAK